MTNSLTAALYLRVSTTRQAEVDLSIPDQLAQTRAYCERQGWRVFAEYAEPGASAMDDNRPVEAALGHNYSEAGAGSSLDAFVDIS